jgi:histidine triad (HIT) family protein
MECIFCKIIEGKIPCYKVYEDNNVFAFLDINPINKGHVLVLSKKHYENLFDIKEPDLIEVIKIVQKVVKTLDQLSLGKGFTIMQNNGKDSGQAVPHIHFHVIPRTSGDKSIVDNLIKKPSPEEMEKIASKIRKEI